MQQNIPLIGQGCVKVTKCNKNLAKINETDWELTENNTIRNKAQNAGKLMTTIKFKKGQTYKINLKLLSNPAADSTFSNYIDGNPGTISPFFQLQNRNLNEVMTKTYTATKDCIYTIRLWGNANVDIFEFQFWIELDETTDYETYKEESVTIPIQREMLSNDYFDRKTNEEVHVWDKKVLNGSEIWINTGNTKMEKTLHFAIAYANSELSSSSINCKCENMKTYSADYLWNNEVEGIAQSRSQLIIRISRDRVSDLNSFKSYLANNNITVFCKTSETRLAMTQEQIKALEELDKLKTYKHITNLTTDSIAILDVEYKKDQETENKKLNDRITALEQMLSTTQISAMLMESEINDFKEEMK